MRIINERMSMDESAYEEVERDTENEVYEMEIVAYGWAEEAAELWIPAKIKPIQDGAYLVKNERGDVSIAVLEKGKWCGYAAAWLPLPEA